MAPGVGERLVLTAAALLAVSGVPGLFLGRGSASGQRLAAALAVAAAAVGLAGTSLCLSSGAAPGVSVPWRVLGGSFDVAVDGLSAAFLLPVFLMAALGSVYGLGYWPQADHPDNGRKLRLFYGVLPAALVLVVTARNAVLFLTAWEVMALSAFFLVSTEDGRPEVCRAGLVYLVTANLGTLLLLALFGLLRLATGSFHLAPLAPGALPPGAAAAAFLLALAGFGLKAGIMPLHVWLPAAHANAPSHVSALLSGVVIKMGIYGIARVAGFLPDPPVWWGGTLLALGAISGVLGVVFAVGQHDLKRLLAYHSIENIGIICLGLGLALLGRSLGRTDWVCLGLAGAVLHVWNHGLFKALLFLSAGSVLHAAHTREIDHLGGLLRRMPVTGLAFLVGAAAICGLPPLNGFVSELLIYLGLFRTIVGGGGGGGPTWPAAALAAPALALIGALAVACFVKVFGVAFLGEPRSARAAQAAESPGTMLAPLGVLGLLCAAIGLLPWLAAPVLDRAVAAWEPLAPPLASLAPLREVSAAGLGLAALLAVVLAAVRTWLRTRPVRRAVTWDCGYAAPSATMQYTASSFAEMLVGLFGWVLRPTVRRPPRPALFAPSGSFASEVPDVVLDGAVLPALARAEGLLGRLKLLHQGRIQAYVLYIFLALAGLLLWR